MTIQHIETLYPDTSREREIAQLVGYVTAGHWCQLVSVPGVGKGNLAELLVYNTTIRKKHFGEHQTKYHFVLMTFTELASFTLFDVTKFLFLSLTDSLYHRKMQVEYEHTHKLFQDAFVFKDETILFSGLKKALEYLVERALIVIFLFDRFKAYIPHVKAEFFTHLTILRSHLRESFCVVFSLNRPLEQMIDTTLFPDLYNTVAEKIIYLSLSDRPSLDFRLANLEKRLEKTLDAKVIEEILRLTFGHWKMTKVAVQEVLGSHVILSQKGEESLQDPSVATLPQDDREELKKFLLNSKAVRSVSYDIWNVLQPQEQLVLKKIASSSHSDPELVEGEESKEIIAFLENIGLITRHSEFISESYKTLKQVQADSKGMFSITIPLFEDFVQYRAEHKMSEKLRLREETNDILKGEHVLTGDLTSAEFKLLRFLLQHPNQVIDREEVIQVVWSDTKSTAGVTDQAIDQLIFRLRRKIEDEPTKPAYLVTVKGRGWQFLP